MANTIYIIISFISQNTKICLRWKSSLYARALIASFNKAPKQTSNVLAKHLTKLFRTLQIGVQQQQRVERETENKISRRKKLKSQRHQTSLLEADRLTV